MNTPTSAFTRTFHVRWGDMDFNAHMKNTAYLDFCGDVRMMFFAENGFPMREFERLRIGPVILRDELDYHRELKLLETVTVDLVLAGLSEDNFRFRIKNHFTREDGQRAARVTSLGGWLSLEARRLVAPPEALLQALLAMPRSDDFETLPSRSR
jgi:acyl-CoA thioester hydrolase